MEAIASADNLEFVFSQETVGREDGLSLLIQVFQR